MTTAMELAGLAGVMPDARLVHAGFALLAGLLFWRLPVQMAILITVLGGWLLLPVGVYPEGSDEAIFPFWIIGIALPSEMLLTKAWVAPVAALIWALVVDARRLRSLRPSLWDLPMLVFCLWPLAAEEFAGGPADPPAAIAAAYLCGAWGASWLLGRVWFADADGRVALLKGLALAGLACLPLALAETGRPAWLYAALYEPHPFRLDGVERGWGFRPIGFFEHGNLYALWVALCTLAAIWVAAARDCTGRRWLWVGVALAGLALTVAAQGRGALLLLGFGLVLMLLWRLGPGRSLLTLGLGLGAALAALHFSGVLPIERWVRGTEAGARLLAALREAGIGSLPWRLSQDVRTLQLIETPLWGSGVWDWWRPAGTRPWGLWQLQLGQLGLVGAGMALTGLLGPALWQLRAQRGAAVWRVEAATIPLALIVVLAVADAFLNAWLFFPAILAAGALVGRSETPPAPALRP